MNPYLLIDAQLDRQAAEKGWVVFREWANAPARFFYIPGHDGHDCFQVSIAPPVLGALVVTACSVDTNDDQNFERVWRGGIDELDSLLALAIDQIEIWESRVS
jgi:hypothetical protein